MLGPIAKKAAANFEKCIKFACCPGGTRRWWWLPRAIPTSTLQSYPVLLSSKLKGFPMFENRTLVPRTEATQRPRWDGGEVTQRQAQSAMVFCSQYFRNERLTDVVATDVG